MYDTHTVCSSKNINYVLSKVKARKGLNRHSGTSCWCSSASVPVPRPVKPIQCLISGYFTLKMFLIQSYICLCCQEWATSTTVMYVSVTVLNWKMS